MASLLNYDPSNVDRIGPVGLGDPTVYRPIADDPLMTSILGQSRGTIVPGTDRLGTSLGFNPHKSSILVISPGNPETGEGGIHIDTSKITTALWNKAMSEATGVEDAYRRVAVAIKEQEAAQQARDAQAEKRAEVSRQAMAAAPAAAPVAAVPFQPVPVQQPPQLVPAASQAPQPAPVPQPAAPLPQPVPAMQPPPAVAPAAPAPDPRFEQMQQTMAAMMAGIAQLTEVVAKSAAATPVSAPAPALSTPVAADPPAAIPPQPSQAVAVTDTPQESPEMMDYLVTGYGPEVKKPTVSVAFELTEGIMATKYHRVRQEPGLLVLEFDSRYDGSQFMPAASAKTIEITVQNKDEAPTTYLAMQQPMLVRFGVIELMIFPLAKRRQESPEQASPAGNPPSTVTQPRLTLDDVMTSAPLPQGVDYGKESSDRPGGNSTGRFR